MRQRALVFSHAIAYGFFIISGHRFSLHLTSPFENAHYSQIITVRLFIILARNSYASVWRQSKVADQSKKNLIKILVN